jgi:hypothetical protein
LDQITHAEWRWLAAILGVLFFIGVSLAPSYGQSTDEYSNYEYAANSLRAYAGSREFIGPSFQELHGPFHLEIAYLAGEAAVRLPLGYTRTDGRHLANFGAFLLGVAGLYVLLRRELKPMASMLTMCLFALQPLLWGQGFINQKDTPFMAYFVLAMALGLTASDRLGWRRSKAQDSPVERPAAGGRLQIETMEAVSAPVSSLSQALSWAAVGVPILLAIATLGNLLFLPAAKSVLSMAYQGIAWQPVQTAFGWIATDAYKTPIGLYMGKLELVYAWAKVPIATAWLVLGAWVFRRLFSAKWERVVDSLPLGLPLLMIAGVVLGLADSIRVAAPLAGVLVGVNALIRHGRRAWSSLIIYAVVALVTTYLTWPWLWISPAASYVQAVRVMSAFPSHKVLFAGIVYSSADIPWDYVPRLLALQTTEVVLPLSIVGLGLMFWKSFQSSSTRTWLATLLIWLGAPLAIIIGLGSSLYGNLRQVLFVLPPLFVFAGAAVEAVLSKLRRLGWQAALAMALLMPGIVWIVALHPYQDSYFNGWVGWTSGAYGRYQVDPWCTSYREATAFLNKVAPEGAVVDVRGPFQSAKDFARNDLQLHPDYRPDPDPDYALMCQVDMLGDGFYGNLPTVHEVRRGQAVMAVVRGRQ